VGLANGRTSIITDPRDGRMPPLTPEAQKRFEADQAYHKQHPHDGPEDMTTIERCITWISSGRLCFPLSTTTTIRSFKPTIT